MNGQQIFIRNDQAKFKPEEEEKKVEAPKQMKLDDLGVTKENFKDVSNSCQCAPGTSQRCANCIDKDIGVKDAKHQSFEHYVAEIKLKCKDKHKPD